MSSVIESEVQKVINVYEELFTFLEQKKEILITRRIDDLGIIDEKIIALYNQIHRLADGKNLRPTEGEREVIRELIQKIQRIELSNQTIIKRSLNNIDSIFSSVLKSVGSNGTGYTQTGKASSKRDLGLSSVIEEA